MTVYNFTLLVSGVDEDRLDDIYEATDGGATVELGGQWTNRIGYDEEADTLAEAIMAAVKQIEEVPGMTVVRIDEDQLVWASEIADRAGRTRQSVDQLVKGQRGPGDFPQPVSGNVRNPLWRWLEVEEWFARYEGREPDMERPAVIGAINAALEARRNLQRRPDPTLAGELEALLRAS